jgi:hypothetical protein
MKQLSMIAFLALFVGSLAWGQQARVATGFNYPLLTGTPTDSLLHGLAEIRGCAFHSDVDGDGKSEIAVTNYTKQGRVHVFETVGNDSIKLVWTSPPLAPASNLTPETVIFGDLDTDGKYEVICQVAGVGICIFEWDGVIGSDNYGTSPSQIIAPPVLSSASGHAQYMEVLDVDGDGVNELLVAPNSTASADKKYYVIHAEGDYSTNDAGFSSFMTELAVARDAFPKYGLSGGSPVAMMAAQFDGVGNKEILLHAFNRKDVTPMVVPKGDTYTMADTSAGKQNIFLSGLYDNVALFGGIACDIDNDGREEIYLPTYYGGTANSGTGDVHMIFYDAGSSTSVIDSATNVRVFNLTSVTGAADPLQPYSATHIGIGYGDLDGNGKLNIYVSGIFFPGSGFNVASMEFQGGDKRNPANWVMSMVYRGDSTFLTTATYTDSLGKKDTASVPWAAMAAKIYAKNTDFDKDGKQDIIVPYQGWFDSYPDSVTVYRRTWNTLGAQYDTVKIREANARRWTLKILERGAATGIELKDLTIITPDNYRLEQNYPNPFNPSTTIRFSLPIASKISLVVYDILGREVRRLIDAEKYERGVHTVTWDGADRSGRPVASGAYIYTMSFGNFSKSGRMTLLK